MIWHNYLENTKGKLSNFFSVITQFWTAAQYFFCTAKKLSYITTTFSGLLQSLSMKTHVLQEDIEQIII